MIACVRLLLAAVQLQRRYNWNNVLVFPRLHIVFVLAVCLKTRLNSSNPLIHLHE